MTIIASENYDSTTVGSLPSGWTPVAGSSWTVTAAHSISAPNALSGPSSSGDGAQITYTGQTALADMEVRYDIAVAAGFVGVLLRSSSDASTAYIVIPDDASNLNATWDIYKRVSGTLTRIDTFAPSGLSGNISVRARIQGTTISIKLWNEGSAEPSGWTKISTDSTITTAGYPGFYNQFAGSSGGSCVDNFTLDNLQSALINGSLSNPTVGTTTATVLDSGASGGTSPYTYQWYRSISPGFTPGSGNLVPGATGATLNDSGLSTGTTYYYKNIVTDHVGAVATSAQLSVTTNNGAATILPVTTAGLFWSPCNWDHLTSGTFGVSIDTMQATAPGAFLKFNVSGTSKVALEIDTAATSGFPSSDMPIVRYSIDGAAFTDVQLAPSQSEMVLATGLSGSNSVEVYFRQSSNTNGYADVWGTTGVSPTNVLRITGVSGDSGISISTPALLPKRMLVFSDSIGAGEHANADGTDDSTQSFAPLVARSLNAELGQICYGGQGWETAGGSNVIPFKTAYAFYSAGRARSFSGLDYVMVAHGGNDARVGSIAGSTIQADCQAWLATMRTACGSATAIFVAVECMGSYASNLSAAVAAYKASSGDSKVYFLDPTPFLPSGVFTLNFATGPFQWTYDGVHPLIFGQGRIGVIYSGLAQAALASGDSSSTSFTRARIVNE